MDADASSPAAPDDPLPSEADGAAAAAPREASTRARLIRLGLLLVGLLVVGELFGIRARVVADPRGAAEELQGAMAEAGPWGVALFVVVFCVGELVHVPGLVFVLAAVFAYGRTVGGLVSYAAGVTSMAFSFGLVRAVGGTALAEIDKPWLKRALAWVDARPVTAIAALRTVLILSPPLNYALALSSVRFRDYLAGSALGLIPPMIVATLLFDQLVARLL